MVHSKQSQDHETDITAADAEHSIGQVAASLTLSVLYRWLLPATVPLCPASPDLCNTYAERALSSALQCYAEHTAAEGVLPRCVLQHVSFELYTNVCIVSLAPHTATCSYSAH